MCILTENIGETLYLFITETKRTIYLLPLPKTAGIFSVYFRTINLFLSSNEAPQALYLIVTNNRNQTAAHPLMYHCSKQPMVLDRQNRH